MRIAMSVGPIVNPRRVVARFNIDAALSVDRGVLIVVMVVLDDAFPLDDAWRGTLNDDISLTVSVEISGQRGGGEDQNRE